MSETHETNESRSSRLGTAGTGLLAGLIGVLAMTLTMSLLRWWAGVPSPAELLGDRMAPTFTAGEFLGLLQRVGGYNQLKQLGVGSVLAGQTLVGLLGGLVFAIIESRRQGSDDMEFAPSAISRPGRLFVIGLVLGFWFVTLIALWPVLGASFIGLVPVVAGIATALGALVSYSTYGFALVFAHGVITGRRLIRSEDNTSAATGRRALLSGGAAALLVVAVGAVFYRLFRLATFSYDGRQYIGPDVEAITPNDQFYTVTKNVIDPRIARPLWRLEVIGMVDRPRSYTFDDLASLAAVTQETTLMCISNWVGGGLMSNAAWRGAPLRRLIEEAGPRPGIVKVLFRAADGYTDTITYEKAMESTTLVAYEMNRAPLPDKHGYPVRVIVPGMFGEKNVKWITRIELVDRNAKGFYEQQGWGPNFTVPTRARFDFPYYDQTIPFTPDVALKGIAFGGDRGVSRVEVSIDGGGTWQDARIDYQAGRLSWVLWKYDWRPQGPGEYKLAVRATDGTGEVQSSEDRGTVPEGATGYHRVTLRLE
jgi:DMSO/TMAO reductase YedYZ molybdopterin-dependent catalytic subunit